MLLAVLLASGGAFTIKVSRPVLLEGDSLTITCHVPELPQSSYDTLEVGIEGYRTSVLEIHSTPWTVDVRVDKVPCGVDTAFCSTVQDHDTHTAKQFIIVSGCER